MPRRWTGFACAVAVSFCCAYNTVSDGCLLTKYSFIETFCENVYSSSSTCFETVSKQPKAFIHWKVHFIALKTLGELAGTVFAAKYSLANGRRSTVLSGYVLTCIGILSAILFANSWFVLSTRFMIGVGNGLVAGPVLVWVSEVVPGSQGLQVTGIQISKCVGQLTAAVCVWLIGDWRFSSAISLIPLPIICLATCFGFWPESSPFQDEKDEKDANSSISNSPKLLPVSEASALLAFKRDRSPLLRRWSSEEFDKPVERGLLSDVSLRLRLFLCCAIFVVNVLGGANAVQNYGSTIVEEAGVSDGNLAEAVVFAFNLFGTVVNIFVIEKTGRKSLLMYGFSVMALLMLGAPILYVAKTSIATIDVIFPIIICIFLFVNAFAVGPVKYVYVSEVFPPELKTNAVQIILFAEIVTSIVASYTLYMIAEIGISISFTVFSLVGFAGVVVVYFLAIETLNKTFLEVDHSFVLSKYNHYFPSYSACCSLKPQEEDEELSA